ncbi:zinc ribbon domain-containing protein [candidate division KSB1 bacterium]|nr:zinc ribbon domain-containing protein [candidate division KSB1 bacterium]
MKPIKYFVSAVFVLCVFMQSARAQADLPAQKLFCPYCSAVNLAASKFCNACGSRLPERTALPLDSLAQINEPQRNEISPSQSELSAVAQRHYEMAVALVGQGRFGDAAYYFRHFAKEHPASEYGRQSEQMAKACEQLVQAQKQAEQKNNTRVPPSSAAFSGAFFGSIAAMLGTMLVIGLISVGS